MKADRAPSCAIKGERLVYVGEPFEFSGVEKELDAEAAAVDGGYFYVAGSHAAKRETCCDNSDSRRVYRLTADENGHIGTMAHSERLWDAMRGLPELASYAVPGDCRCDRAPGRNRVDIEGMAAANGRLFFALRGRTWKETPTSSASTQGLFSRGAILDPLSQRFGWAPIRAFEISQSRTAWLSRLLDPATLNRQRTIRSSSCAD